MKSTDRVHAVTLHKLIALTFESAKVLRLVHSTACQLAKPLGVRKPTAHMIMGALFKGNGGIAPAPASSRKGINRKGNIPKAAEERRARAARYAQSLRFLTPAERKQVTDAKPRLGLQKATALAKRLHKVRYAKTGTTPAPQKGAIA